MFFNSKKLIEEKVLQQYYFERLMLGKTTDRKKNLIPPEYRRYASEIKGLNPEVKVGKTSKGTIHKTDFVLYPTPSSNLSPLNIEVKWALNDFVKQRERWRFYDGRTAKGFLVCLEVKSPLPPYVPNSGKGGGQPIPVLGLKAEEFQKWFVASSETLVAQTLSSKFGVHPSRPSGMKYWVVAIGSGAKNHYQDHGRPNGIWAFRDAVNPRRIMKILAGDYILFFHFREITPGRAIFPELKTHSVVTTSRGAKLRSANIRWSIDWIDTRRVSKGYHLDFSARPPYDGFDAEWVGAGAKAPEEKEFTQFIRTEDIASDAFCKSWRSPPSSLITRSQFKATNEPARELVTALRESHNGRGDAREISPQCFRFLLGLIS